MSPGPFAQRRKVDAENRKPKIEVFAEISRCDLLFQIAVRGGNNTHVHTGGAGFPDLKELAAFEYAQQLGLQLYGHFADLVEKQRAFVGFLKKSFFVFGGSRETARTVTEEFAFEQFPREGRAVDRHESAFSPWPGVVNSLREDFLAGPGFAGEQHRSICGSDFPRQIDGLTHGRGLPDDAVERMLLGKPVFDPCQPSLHLGFLRGAAQQGQDFVVVVAFGDVVESPVLDGLYAVGNIAVGRE